MGNNLLCMHKFIIISSGYNCSDKVRFCLNSVNNLGFKNWEAVFISDGSTDNTAIELLKHKANPKFHIDIYNDNVGAAKRRYDAIKQYSKSPDDIIVLLGLDDALMPQALNYISDKYDEGSWMTYGTWMDQKGVQLMKDNSFDIYFPDSIHESRDYRKVAFRATAPNTFRRFLFDELTEDDFKINGEWFTCTTESNMMFCFLEMCGKERIGVITTAIYIYNMRGSESTKNRIGASIQKEVYNEVISRPKKPLLTERKSVNNFLNK